MNWPATGSRSPGYTSPPAPPPRPRRSGPQRWPHSASWMPGSISRSLPPCSPTRWRLRHPCFRNKRAESIRAAGLYRAKNTSVYWAVGTAWPRTFSAQLPGTAHAVDQTILYLEPALAIVLAGFSSTAQVQRVAVSGIGGQQPAVSAAVAGLGVAPPQDQQGASTLSMIGIPSRVALAGARSRAPRGANPTLTSRSKESCPATSSPALFIPTPDGVFSGAK